MRGAVLYGPGDVRFEERVEPTIVEPIGTQEAMTQAIGATRPGGSVGYVGVPHGVSLDGESLFFTHVRLHGGPAPVRRR